jgi:hypothetical protein
MDVTVRIPDDLAQRLGTAGELERRALEALALEGFRLGHLTKPELGGLPGFGTRDALDGFLKAHDVFEPYSRDDLARERQDLHDSASEAHAARRCGRRAAQLPGYGVRRREGVRAGQFQSRRAG